MKLSSDELNKAIRRLDVGQLFSVLDDGDIRIDCWQRAEGGCTCLVNEHGHEGGREVFPFSDPWGCQLELRVYDMDESARIAAILALMGKLPWA